LRVEISNPDKVLFPAVGLTKADLAGYYERIAGPMVPHLRNRPISMHRFPDGVDAGGFFHKDVPDHFPHWINRVRVRKADGSLTQAVVCDAETLVYLADQACITPHVWLSRSDRLEHPDRMVFDLDPSGKDFGAVRRAARSIGELLDELDLPRFAMTTGSRGIHVWVPLKRRHDFDYVRSFARDVARLMERRDPELVTTEQRKRKRGGRILIDVMRNAYAQTAVPPYAVRPHPKAPVATPIPWEELSDSRLRPDRWTVRNVFSRLARRDDPWREMSSRARTLTRARERLARLAANG
jgi:bifunctional non-homologous end joining protein LigD